MFSCNQLNWLMHNLDLYSFVLFVLFVLLSIALNGSEWWKSIHVTVFRSLLSSNVFFMLSFNKKGRKKKFSLRWQLDIGSFEVRFVWKKNENENMKCSATRASIFTLTRWKNDPQCRSWWFIEIFSSNFKKTKGLFGLRKRSWNWIAIPME